MRFRFLNIALLALTFVVGFSASGTGAQVVAVQELLNAISTMEFTSLMARAGVTPNFQEKAFLSSMAAVPVVQHWEPTLRSTGRAAVGALYVAKKRPTDLDRGAYLVFVTKRLYPSEGWLMDFVDQHGTLKLRRIARFETVLPETAQPKVTLSKYSPETICWWDDKIRVCSEI